MTYTFYDTNTSLKKKIINSIQTQPLINIYSMQFANTDFNKHLFHIKQPFKKYSLNTNRALTNSYVYINRAFNKHLPSINTAFNIHLLYINITYNNHLLYINPFNKHLLYNKL